MASRGLTGNVTSCCPSTESHRAGLQGTQLWFLVQELHLLKNPLLLNIALLFTSSSSVLQSYVAKTLHTNQVAAAIINCYTALLTAVTRVTSPVFMAARLCFLLKTSWFSGLNSDTQHRSRTQHCFTGAGWEMHSFPSSWNTRCCHWKQDWLIQPNLDYLSTNCRGRPDTELYFHFSIFSPFPSPLFYCFFWLFLYWISVSFLFSQ